MWEGEVGGGSNVAQLCLDPRVDRSYLKLCFLEIVIALCMKGLFIHKYSIAPLQGKECHYFKSF